MENAFDAVGLIQTIASKLRDKKLKNISAVEGEISALGGYLDTNQMQTIIFRYRLKPTFDFMQEIFSHADNFEVLEPKWLCDEISRRVYNMYKYYSREGN